MELLNSSLRRIWSKCLKTSNRVRSRWQENELCNIKWGDLTRNILIQRLKHWRIQRHKKKLNKMKYRKQQTCNLCMLQAVTQSRLARSLLKQECPMWFALIRMKPSSTKLQLNSQSGSMTRYLILTMTFAQRIDLPRKRYVKNMESFMLIKSNCSRMKTPMELNVQNKMTQGLHCTEEIWNK